MSKMDEWSRRNNIKFNNKESKMTLVRRRKRTEEKNITIYLHFQTLQQVTQLKYLGIILDSKFKFQDHVKYLAERCTRIIHNKSSKTVI